MTETIKFISYSTITTFGDAMVKEISYIECDCKKGKLEKIAETGILWDSCCGGTGDRSVFYKCDNLECRRVYQQNIELGGEPGMKDTMGEIKIYTGKLSSEQIKKYASLESGILIFYKEEEILKKMTLEAENQYTQSVIPKLL